MQKQFLSIDKFARQNKTLLQTKTFQRIPRSFCFSFDI